MKTNEPKKKLTETEELELNTKIEKAKEQAEGVAKYLMVHNHMSRVVSKRSLQAIGVSILCLAVSIALDVKGLEILSTVFNLLWLIFFLLHLIMENIKSRTQGEFDGAWEMLVLLGHVNDDDVTPPKKRKKTKKKSWFARPKEFFERVGKSKEAYGT